MIFFNIVFDIFISVGILVLMFMYFFDMFIIFLLLLMFWIMLFKFFFFNFFFVFCVNWNDWIIMNGFFIMFLNCNLICVFIFVMFVIFGLWMNVCLDFVDGGSLFVEFIFRYLMMVVFFVLFCLMMSVSGFGNWIMCLFLGENEWMFFMSSCVCVVVCVDCVSWCLLSVCCV